MTITTEAGPATRTELDWAAQVRTLVRRELRAIRRDKIAVVMIVVAPIAAALIASVSLGATHQVRATIAVAVPAGTDQLVTSSVAGLGRGDVRVVVVPSADGARELVRRGKASAAVVADPSHDRFAVIANRNDKISESIAKDAARLASAPGAEAVFASGASTASLATTTNTTNSLSGAELYGPVIAVFFLFLTTGLVARSLLVERANGTLARMRVAGVRGDAILASKGIMMVIVGATEVLAVYGAMAVVFGAGFGNTLAAGIVSISIILAVAAIALVIAALARTLEQAQAFEIVVALVLAALGGNLVALANLPPFAAFIARLTPNGLAIAATRDVAAGAGLRDVLGPVLAILTFAVVLGAIALNRAQRIVAR